jgi:hypothetical protein
MMWWRITLVVALAAAALLFQGGCILSPRSPDGPPEGDQTDWETPIDTDTVLRNIRTALAGESINNYRDSFTEDYRFHVDPQDSLDAGEEGEERYANWTREDEVFAANGMFTDAASISVTFSNVEAPQEELDETFRKEDYTLTVAWQSGPHVNEEIVYRGRATLWMRREAGRWAIFRWVDRRGDPPINDTWGVLRGEYRG